MIDIINAPPHYITPSGIEAIDVIEQYGLGYHLGNAMKYLLRAGRKDPAREREDLEKARWYLKRWRDGIYQRWGIENPVASDDTQGGLCWADPHKIVDAFGLVGGRREAAILVLEAACFGDEEERIAGAEAALDKVLA